MTGAVDWYAARAAGVVAYVLLTSGVLVGVTLSGRARLPRWPAFAVTDVHRFLGLLSGIFIGVHVGAIALDTYTPFSLTQLVVPGASRYRPLWVALGIVAAELLAAIGLTNLLRTRLPFTLWRRVHYLTFVVWAASTGHGIGAGTDAGTPWLRLLYVAAIAGVLAAIAWRVARRPLPVAATLAAAAAIGLAVLPHGLGSTQPARAATAAAPGAVTGAFSGTVEQQQGAGGALVSVVGRTGRLLVRVDLVTPDGQTIGDTALQVRDTATGAICTGTVATVGPTGFRGTCSFPGGATRSVGAAWRVSRQHIAGRLRLSA